MVECCNSEGRSRSPRAIERVAIATFFFLLPALSSAVPMGEAWIDQAPTVAQVARDVQGSDPVDTGARQAAAFSILWLGIQVWTDRVDDGQMSSRAAAKWGEYRRAWSAKISEVGNIKPLDYSQDTAFIRDLLGRYFAPDYVQAVLEWKEKARRPRLPTTIGAPPPRAADPVQAAATVRPVAGSGPSATEVLLLAGMVALLVLGLARESRPFGLDEGDPLKVNGGWGMYRLYKTTGTVLSPTKSHVVTTHVSGGGGNRPVTSSTSETIHDQFFIRDCNGGEQSIQVTDVNVALREGHELSAAWAIPKGKEQGPYFLFRNHSTQSVDFIDRVVRDMLKPHKWPVLPLLGSAVMLAWWLKSDALLLVALPGALVIFFIVRSYVIRGRVAQFKREVGRRFVPILDQRADEDRLIAGRTR